MDNTEIVEVTAIEENKQEIKRYVMLIQHKNEKRGAEILHKLPNSKIELKALYLEALEKYDMPFEGSRMVDIFLVNKKAVDVIHNWTNWKTPISKVYEACIDAWLNDPKTRPYADPKETHKASFTDFIKPSEFTEYTA